MGFLVDLSFGLKATERLLHLPFKAHDGNHRERIRCHRATELIVQGPELLPQRL